jgi:hypothetical protein
VGEAPRADRSAVTGQECVVTAHFQRFSHIPEQETFRKYIPLSITNKMYCYTIFFIALNALHVSGGFFAHHQELKTVKLACCYR